MPHLYHKPRTCQSKYGVHSVVTTVCILSRLPASAALKSARDRTSTQTAKVLGVAFSSPLFCARHVSRSTVSSIMRPTPPYAHPGASIKSTYAVLLAAIWCVRRLKAMQPADDPILRFQGHCARRLDLVCCESLSSALVTAARSVSLL